jgi:hypothetical protein
MKNKKKKKKTKSKLTRLRIFSKFLSPLSLNKHEKFILLQKKIKIIDSKIKIIKINLFTVLCY